MWSVKENLKRKNDPFPTHHSNGHLYLFVLQVGK